LALPELANEEFQKILEQYTQNFRHLVVIPYLLGLSSLWVEARDMDGLLGLEVRQQLLIPQSRLLKRSVDLIGATLGLVMISPLLMLIVILVKLDSAGPLFFVQERLGYKGQLFKAYKFRSMYQDAEQRLQQILETDAERRQEYEKFHKLRQDPRVTWLGRLLRKLSLDELPQLWNVIRGEMSLVGPRAYMPQEQHEMEGKEHTILQVVPGITGLWQVSGRNHLSFQQRLDLDIYYVRNWSIWLDIHILARTIWVVLTGHGAL
jgi:Undecaprenyl-phosphate galactose phosphotransferase WbaP